MTTFRGPEKASKQKNEPSQETIEGFIAEVAQLARSVDPMLALILGHSADPPAGGSRWTKGRKSGLEFCLTMLGYARMEAVRYGDSRRIDRAISHIVLELTRSQLGAGFVAVP